MMIDLILRTHGGLGNQLFQILYGRLFADCHDLILKEVHDLHYYHAFPRSGELVQGDSPSSWQRLVSAARVPKILHRLIGLPEAPWQLGRSTYLDAYFQNAEDYEQYPADAIERHLQRLADELGIGPANKDLCLVHLRLGDFFTNRSAAKAHVFDRLKNLPVGARVMTNDELLLLEPDVVEAMGARGAELVSTKGMKAEEVLRTMAQYAYIDANDSTLTFWSSVLAGCNVKLCNERLRACRDLLIRYRPHR